MLLIPNIFSPFSNVVAGQTTRQGGISSAPFDSLNLGYSTGDLRENVDENIKRILKHLDITQMARCNQTHSDNIAIAEEPIFYPDTDALISYKPNLFVGILIADCVPILILDSKQLIVASIHAGWRGTQKQIVLKTLQMFYSSFNSKPENMFAFIGACISRESYEVGIETASFFPEAFLTPSSSDKYLLDLKAANQHQLMASGIPSSQIEISPLCTSKDNELLFSHRRNSGKTGRMMALIGIKA